MNFTQKQRKHIANVAWYVCTSFLCLVMLLPFLWTLVSSFKPNNEIFAKALSFWSSGFTLEHYATVFRQMPMLKYTLNSMIVAFGLVFTNLFSCLST